MALQQIIDRRLAGKNKSIGNRERFLRRHKQQIREATTWDLIKTNRNWLGFWFMLPAMGFLIFFLAYPLGLGIWISFTDAKIGRPGHYIGVENYEWLWDDSIFWLSVFNTLLYTFIASAIRRPAICAGCARPSMISSIAVAASSVVRSRRCWSFSMSGVNIYSSRKLRSRCRPSPVSTDSGWNCTP